MEGQSAARERRRRWIRVSCWVMVAVVAIVGGPLGLLIRSARGKHRAVQALRERGASVEYRQGDARMPGHQVERHPLIPDLWVEVAVVDLGDRDIGDNELAWLDELPDLETLVLRNTRVTDRGMSCLAHLPRLTYLDLHGTRISDATVVLVGDERHLQDLDLGETQISDAGIEHLSQLERLRSLDLSGTKITELALTTLSALPKLKWLGLANVAIAPATIEAWSQSHPQVAVSAARDEASLLAR